MHRTERVNSMKRPYYQKDVNQITLNKLYFTNNIRGCLSLPNWTGTLTLSPLLKLPLRKLER